MKFVSTASGQKSDNPHTDTDTHRQTDTQTHRQRHTDTDTQTETHRQRQTGRERRLRRFTQEHKHECGIPDSNRG